MPSPGRLLTSVPPQQREQFRQLATARGVSASQLLARLVDAALAESSAEAPPGLPPAAAQGGATVERYTVRLTGIDAAHLEHRAEGRRLSSSQYAAHVLRAHLRADPPMPYVEFQAVRRAVIELAEIRATLGRLLVAPRGVPLDASLSQSVSKLLPALKQLRERIQDALIASSKSWEASDG